MIYATDFGQFISEKRNEFSLTATELAKKLDISIGYLCQLEHSNRVNTDITLLKKLIAVFELDKNEIAYMYESFYKHEIQFSALIGGHKNAFENFREFMTDYDVEEETDHKMLIEKLYSSLDFLSKSERDLIKMLFYENKTERECAKILCTSQQNAHKNKKQILCKLHKLLKIE